MGKSRIINHLQLSILLSVSLFLITLTFRGYFYYTPFSSGFNLLSILQFLTICGWILLVAIPPLAFSSEFKWSSAKYWFFLFSVTLWTLSTLLIKVYTVTTLGTLNYQYLTTFPILIYFEWLVPALYVYLAFNYYKPVAVRQNQTRISKQVRFEDEDEDVEIPSSRSRERFDD